jgi:hypothetical protein
MGACNSVNCELDDIAVKSPFCEFVLKHCESSCLKKAPDEEVQPAPNPQTATEDQHKENAVDATDEMKK